MILPRDLATAEHVIYTSGAADQFRAALTSAKGGRRPTFDQALFLLGMYLSVEAHGKSHVRRIHDVLTTEVPLEWQLKWGIRRVLDPAHPNEVWVIAEADLQNVSRSLKRALNHTPAFLPARLVGDHPERARRKAGLEAIMDTITDATLIARPAGGLDYAIDDTGLWASERARRKILDTEVEEGDEEVVPAPTLPEDAVEDEPEPTGPRKRRSRREATDASYGVKTRKDGKRTWFFGYALHALVRVPEESRDGIRTEPPLVQRIRLIPAGQDIVEVSLALIDSVLATGQGIRYLLGDRHYSYKRIERWLYELLKRGISQVVTLREDDHGFRDWEGMQFVAGHAHCPQVPEHLGVIKEPGTDATSEEWDDFYASIEERQAYACQRTLPLNINGETRWRCPALNGTVGCPKRAGTMQAARSLGLPLINQPPEHTLPICTQDSVGLRATNETQGRLLKTHQKHYWGSRIQIALAKRRTFVEGWFGTFKGDSAANKNRGSSLYTGLAHASIEVSIFSAVANVINLRSWHDETGLGDPTHPLLAEPEYHGFRYLSRQEHDQHIRDHLDEHAA